MTLLTAAVPCLLLIASVSLGAEGEATALQDPVHLEPVRIAPGQSVTLTLPALPARAGLVTALGFRAYIAHQSPAGCNYNASVLVNGAPVGRRDGGGQERLLGRPVSFELTGRTDSGFSVFSGERIMAMFAPDAEQADAMSEDGLGGTFLLDIADLVSGVDGNSLQFGNHLATQPEGAVRDLVVQDIAVGWLDRASLPAPKMSVPERGEVSQTVERGDITLRQSTAGGFIVQSGGAEVLVETGLGMTPSTDSCLIADDAAGPGAGVSVAIEPSGPAGFALQANWESVGLRRTVAIEDGVVRWRETWTNLGEQITGIPFRHRVFPRQGATDFRLGGSDGGSVLAGSPGNPTLYLETADGSGAGITAESDWLRLLVGLRYSAGGGEVYSTTLALAPGKQVSFELTLTPVAAGDGYFGFINGVRKRWGVGGVTQQHAVFWGYARPGGEMDEDERVRQALSHLGPVYVVLGPWQRLVPDARVVTAGRYPKLPVDAPPAPGGCPDLDVDAFLTFAHREPYHEQLRLDVERIRRAAPNVKVMQMLHPAMEAVYKPLAHRWPIADEAILTPEGKPFETSHYSRAWLGDYVDRDWGVLYYVPLPGSEYLRQVLGGVERAFRELDLDGIYCDEFSWAGTRRGYSRYDYGRWDGYSADLDENGKVLRLKSDNGSVTESCQLQMVHEALGRDRYFLGNGPNVLRSLNGLPHARFVEGGNGQSAWPQNHLSPTPLILGNMGDETTSAGVLAAVRSCLQEGCLYSPTAVNLLLDGPDNFVCRQYPITVEELGPGWVVGRERVVTSVSRQFDWSPEPRAEALLYRYDKTGALLDKIPATAVDGRLSLEVPEGGLVIAEAGVEAERG